MYHMPNHRLIQLAKELVIPYHLSKLKDKPFICTSCRFGQTHKRPWQKKGKHTNPTRSKDDVNPGDCVSTYQIVSAQPGMVPQTSVYLTSNRILGIPLFVGNATDYIYGHLMRSLDLDETLGANKAFEKLVGRLNNTVKRYHADNGRYSENGLMASLNANSQTIILCGVGAHHHNGIVEQRIRTVTEISRTILLHAQRYWPEYVDTMIWHFAVNSAIERLNFLRLCLDENNPTAKFYNIKNIKPNAHEYHTFGCPVYVLNSKLQSVSIGPPKWEPRS